MTPEQPPPSEVQFRLLLIEPDQTSAAFMRHMLTRAGFDVAFAPGGKEGLIAAWRDRPDAVLLELDLPDLDGLDVIRRLRGDPRTQNTRILCLTRRSDPQSAQLAHELGIEEYVVKQTEAVDLVMRRLANLRQGQAKGERAASSGAGQLVAFLGAKGGVGTSSLCLNFAHEIASLDLERQVVVVDLVLPMGHLATFTGVDSPIDIVSLTSEAETPISPDSLHYDLPRPEGWQLQVIPGADHPARGAELVPDRLAPFIQLLRSSYSQVYVDVGRNLSPLAMLVLSQADVLVMVLNPSPSVVGHTAAALTYLKDEGIQRDQFFLLSNRPLGMEDLSNEDVVSVLGQPPHASVPHLGDNMYISNRLGLPLQTRFARINTTRMLREAAGQLAARLGQTQGA